MPNENSDDRTSLGAVARDNVVREVADKIDSCENILVAMNRNPSVDEISAAIGLTMILNQLGKHVTAIYSGKTPNALEFLNPSATFEKDTNSLQDFIIALSKDKADHLRYEVKDGFVKVYITPYRSTITKDDLEFSKGDYNVDLVISIDVSTSETLDAALREHGRIMHDATSINITTNQSGRFADQEWSDPSKSSICEMIVDLLDLLNVENLDQPTATALLTGIVSETDRFSNARTTFETMQVASRLMQAGADQLLITSNINSANSEPVPAPEVVESDQYEDEMDAPAESLIPSPSIEATPEMPAAPEMPTAPEMPVAPAVANVPEMPLASAAPETPVAPVEPTAPTEFELPMNPAAQNAPSIPNESFEAASLPSMQYETASVTSQVTPRPAAPQMMQMSVPPEALQNQPQPVPVAPTAPEMPVAPVMPTAPTTPIAPVEPVAPVAPAMPPQNLGGIELPPPPVPDINMGAVMPPAIAVSPEPVMPPVMPTAPAEPTTQPAPTAPTEPTAPAAQTYEPLSDPSAFHIPNA